jgi:hypothetical protein
MIHGEINVDFDLISSSSLWMVMKRQKETINTAIYHIQARRQQRNRGKDITQRQLDKSSAKFPPPKSRR